MVSFNLEPMLSMNGHLLLDPDQTHVLLPMLLTSFVWCIIFLLFRHIFHAYFSKWTFPAAFARMDSLTQGKYRKVYWHLFAYAFLWMCDIWLILQFDWPKHWIPGWMGSSINLVRERQLAALTYSMQIGFYFHTILEVFVLERQLARSDMGMLIFHHVLTLALLIGSWSSYHTRIGICVLLVIEPGDIMLYTGKIFHYARPKAHALHYYLLIGIVTVWFWSRLVGLGTLALSSVYCISHLSTNLYPDTVWMLSSNFLYGASVTLSSFLCALLILQAVWWFYMMNICFNSSPNGPMVDTLHDESSSKKARAAARATSTLATGETSPVKPSYDQVEPVRKRK